MNTCQIVRRILLGLPALRRIPILLIVLFLLLPIQPAMADLTDGLVAHWKLDETSGATAMDSSGSGNHGTLINGPVWTAGRIRGALSFDAVNDYVSVADSTSLSPANQLTVSAWINGTSWTDADRKGVVIKGHAYYLTVTPAGNVAVYAYGKSPTGYHVSNATLALNTWYHVALTIDADQFRIYINGVLDKSVAATGGITVTTSQLVLGAEWNGNSRFFAGRIDDVRIYSRALAEQELVALVNAAGRKGVRIIKWVEIP